MWLTCSPAGSLLAGSSDSSGKIQETGRESARESRGRERRRDGREHGETGPAGGHTHIHADRKSSSLAPHVYIKLTLDNKQTKCDDVSEPSG